MGTYVPLRGSWEAPRGELRVLGDLTLGRPLRALRTIAAMSSVITFIGNRGDQPLTLAVALPADKVMAACNSANGKPFRFEDKQGKEVFVQPATIAFWR